jgi:hypothetical protein
VSTSAREETLNILEDKSRGPFPGNQMRILADEGIPLIAGTTHPSRGKPLAGRPADNHSSLRQSKISRYAF